MARYNIGDYLIKPSNALFNFNYYNETFHCAYDIVRSVFTTKSGSTVINGNLYPKDFLPVVTTKEEAEKREKLWQDILKLEVNESINKEHEHTREDNGADKQNLITELNAKKTLFKFSVTYPEYNYGIYRCSKCNGIHLGKLL